MASFNPYTPYLFIMELSKNSRGHAEAFPHNNTTCTTNQRAMFRASVGPILLSIDARARERAKGYRNPKES